jgi:hypothetical protein
VAKRKIESPWQKLKFPEAVTATVGLEYTVTVRRVVSVHPLSEITFSKTEKVPTVGKLYVTDVPEAVPTLPKLQLDKLMDPGVTVEVLLNVKLLPSKH